MKLTDDKINAMAAELLGYCDGLNLNDLTAKGYCKACGKGVLDDTHDVPDFIHDANAVRELVGAVDHQEFEHSFDSDANAVRELVRAVDHQKFEHSFDSLYWEHKGRKETFWGFAHQAITTPVRIWTLASLVTVGKITLEQAREAMEGDGDE